MGAKEHPPGKMGVSGSAVQKNHYPKRDDQGDSRPKESYLAQPGIVAAPGVGAVAAAPRRFARVEPAAKARHS